MRAVKFFFSGVVIGTIGLAAPAFAQDSAPSGVASHIYIGANGGQGHWRALCPNSSSCEDTNGTLAVFAGYTFNRIFSAEAAFRNYGEAKSPNATIKGKGWDFTGVAAWPLTESLSIFGRLGMYRSVLKGDGTLLGAKETTTGATYGGGLEFEINKNVALRGEYQAYSSMGGSALPKGDLSVLTVGALWRFR